MYVHMYMYMHNYTHRHAHILLYIHMHEQLLVVPKFIIILSKSILNVHVHV